MMMPVFGSMPMTVIMVVAASGVIMPVRMRMLVLGGRLGLFVMVMATASIACMVTSMAVSGLRVPGALCGRCTMTMAVVGVIVMVMTAGGMIMGCMIMGAMIMGGVIMGRLGLAGLMRMMVVTAAIAGMGRGLGLGFRRLERRLEAETLYTKLDRVGVVEPSASASDSVSFVTEILMSETPGSFSSAVRIVAAQLPQSMPPTFQVTDFVFDISALALLPGGVICYLLDRRLRRYYL